jgi:hypothetical protein
VDTDPIEGVAGPSAQATFVEVVGDLGIGVLVEEGIDLLAHVLVRDAPLLGGERARDRQRRRSAAAEADADGHLVLLEERDVFDEQGEHPLALAVRGLRVAPDGRDIGGEREDARAFVLVDDETIAGALALVLLLRLGQRPQPRVPVGFEGVGDEAVGRIDLEVAIAGMVGVVLRAFDVAVRRRSASSRRAVISSWTASVNSSAIGVTVSTSSWATAA